MQKNILIQLAICCILASFLLYKYADTQNSTKTAMAHTTHDALWHAVAEGSYEEIAQYIANGASLHEEVAKNIANGECIAEYTTQSILHRAVQRGDIEIVKLLLKHGADVHVKAAKTGWSPLHEAASSGSTELAALLLEHGADINAINEPQEPGDHIPEEPPLHVAARKDHLPMVQFLVERGANINQLRQAPNVISVLHNALETHNKEMIQYLLEHGANIKNKGVRPILMEACVYEVSTEILDLLIKYNADVNEQDEIGLTPLMVAAFTENECHVQYLLEHHADVQLIDEIGYTALHLAIQNINDQGNITIAKLLLESGADIHYSRDDHRPSALDLARVVGQIDMIDLLLASNEC